VADREECVFCRIVRGETPAHIVYEDEQTIAFLDHRPLFAGHVLVLPKAHHETLAELPPALLEPLFATAQLLAWAVEQGMQAEGTFVAINNRVSQSVPHLHIHVVPRRQKDGLFARGHLWKRQPYKDRAEMDQVQAALTEAVTAAQQATGSA